ncbi:T9SS type A sorting domain-containing protein [Halocola ammonii]
MRRKITLSFLTCFIALVAMSQDLTIVSPEGLSAPYEVAPGTEITFQWDWYSDPPTSYFTHDEEPVLPDFGTDPEWSEYSNVVDNGDGTYNFTVTANEEMWVWAGFFQMFFGSWAYSEVYHIEIASGVTISYEDGIVCPDGSGIELLSAEDTYDSYQWYLDGEAIEGATENSYSATESGAYKVEVEQDGEFIFSNTLNVIDAEISISGSYTSGSSQLEIDATGGFDSYQWLSGPDASNLSDIDGETASSTTVNITSDIVYYAAEATLNGCTVQTEARPVSESAFTTPQVHIDQEVNEFGNVCEGQEVTLSTDEVYGSYAWFNNGMDAFYTNPTYTIAQAWQEGDYTVQVTPVGWPEITIESEPQEVDFFEVTQPNLISDADFQSCVGDEINVTLADEGYDYTWYMHTEFDYTEDDIVEFDGNTLTFNFEEQVRVTVVATFEGCSSSSTSMFNAAADANLSANLVNWEDQFLCVDSIAEMEVPSWAQGDYNSFQWFVEVDGEFEIIEGATETTYSTSEIGVYAVEGELDACDNVFIMSSPIEIQDYTERNLSIYTDNAQLCMGDTAELVMSAGENWNSIQWFEETIEIGNQGYEELFSPLIGAGSSSSQEVTEFNSYQVKARHYTCPNGIKLTSNIIDIRPRVNPDITAEPNYGVNGWNVAPWDSIASYLYCVGEPVTLSVPEGYDSYSWHHEFYAGDDDFQIGDAIEGENGASTDVTATGADWYTAIVDSSGCVGVSDPILLDTWVFAPPTITSYNNSELCGAGDSTLIHVSFPGNYANVEWFLNGTLIEGENNDSLYATEPGQYVVSVYREECPDFGMSSGVGPIVTILEAQIVEEETLIYALPQEGFYTYQWYLDGEPIEAPEDTPWLLYKDDMADGTYTVEVTNPEPCTVVSPPFEWIVESVEEYYEANLKIFPNPTSAVFQIDGIESSSIEKVKIMDISGKVVESYQTRSNGTFSLAGMENGLYFIEIQTVEGVVLSRKVLKQ